MDNTRTHNRRLVKFAGVSILVLAIAAFAMSRSLNYARGPEISIIEPANGATINSPTVIIRGMATRVNKIALNGNPISMDEQGNWNETVVIFSGLNKITVSATDRFGRSIEKTLDLVGEI
jgi:hypothetical protein